MDFGGTVASGVLRAAALVFRRNEVTATTVSSNVEGVVYRHLRYAEQSPEQPVQYSALAHLVYLEDQAAGREARFARLDLQMIIEASIPGHCRSPCRSSIIDFPAVRHVSKEERAGRYRQSVTLSDLVWRIQSSTLRIRVSNVMRFCFDPHIID